MKAGGIVADLGSGVGYFTLQLSDLVGNPGRVLAVDTLRCPLFLGGRPRRLEGRTRAKHIRSSHQALVCAKY